MKNKIDNTCMGIDTNVISINILIQYDECMCHFYFRYDEKTNSGL